MKGLEVGSAEHNLEIKRRAEKRFERIDALPADVRAVIHEYGWAPVQELMALGVTKAAKLERLIRLCRGERA